jgi:hypothetical protein
MTDGTVLYKASPEYQDPPHYDADSCLSPEHQRLLRESAIAPDIARERGYRTVTDPAELTMLGFAPYQRLVPGLLMPSYDVHGRNGNCHYRPDRPRLKDGKPVKYETPTGARLALDVPKRMLPLLRDRSVPLWITEGERKVDAAVSAGLCCIGVSGVWGWCGTDPGGGKGVALIDWREIPVNDRDVVIAFDSDVMTKQSVRDSLDQKTAYLRGKGARVRFLMLPAMADGSKMGLDDFLGVAGHSADELPSLIRDELPPLPSRLRRVSMADVQSKPISWLWPGWLAKGKLHLFAGAPGDGKSTIAAALAAIGSTGGKWPDGSQAPQFRTLILLAEDGIEDTLKPRLELHGADVRMIDAIDILSARDEKGRARMFHLREDYPDLESEIEAGRFDLVVIDPIGSFMQGTDRNSEGDVRDMLTTLRNVAENSGAAILGVAHLGKPGSNNRTLQQRVMGSTAFTAVPRIVWVSAVSKDGERALGPCKSNLSALPPALIWERDVDGPIQWLDQSSDNVNSMEQDVQPTKPRSSAKAFLSEYLSTGMKLAADIEKVAAERGIAKRTLDRAKKDMGVESWRPRHLPDEPWYWLPPGTSKPVPESQP